MYIKINKEVDMFNWEWVKSRKYFVGTILLLLAVIVYMFSCVV